MGACTSTGEQKYKMDDMVGGRPGSARSPPVDGYKLVILGRPRSGKTTLHQQMKCVFGPGFTPAEIAIARPHIISYIVNIARALVWHADRRRLDTPSLPHVIRRAISRLTGNETILTSDIVDHLTTLWNEPAIQSLYHQRAALYTEVGDTHAFAVIPDSTAYFFTRVSSLASPDYQLTNDDILRHPLSTLHTINGITHQPNTTTSGASTNSSNNGTNGVTTNKMNSTSMSDPIRNLDLRLAPRTPLPKSFGVPRFRVIDAGGATHSRMQWLQCIDNVHAVLFVAALSHYDHMLPSSNASPLPITTSTTTMVEPIVQSSSSSSSSVSATASTSSHKTTPSSSFFTPSSSLSHRSELMESLNLFEDICRSPWFIGSHIIILFTKSDILKEKCTSVPLRNTCPDYTGTDDYASYVDYIRRQYLNRATAGYRARHHAATTQPPSPPASSLGTAVPTATTTAASSSASSTTTVSPSSTGVTAPVSSSNNGNSNGSPSSGALNGHHHGHSNGNGNGSHSHSDRMPEIFTHVVTATDTDGVRTVFDSIKLTIVGANIPAKLE